MGYANLYNCAAFQETPLSAAIVDLGYCLPILSGLMMHCHSAQLVLYALKVTILIASIRGSLYPVFYYDTAVALPVILQIGGLGYRSYILSIPAPSRFPRACIVCPVASLIENFDVVIHGLTTLRCLGCNHVGVACVSLRLLKAMKQRCSTLFQDDLEMFDIRLDYSRVVTYRMALRADQCVGL